MNLASILGYISLLIWLLPIFRQRGSRFFYYFLILGLSDPMAFLSIKVLAKYPEIVYAIAAILLYQSLNIGEDKKFKLDISDYLIGTISIALLPVIDNLIYLITVLHILIIFRIVRIFIVKLFERSELNLFIGMLIFYEITLVAKLLVAVTGTTVGLYYFYLTTFFQIFIGLFFTFYTEKSRHMLIRTENS